MTADQWTYWRAALAGEIKEDLIQRGNPQSGYYRDRSTRAVAIWRDPDGLRCSVTSGYAPRHDDEIDELFGFVCRSPITRDLFMAIQKGGAWPEDVEEPARGIGDNSASLAPHEDIMAQINALADAARDWLKGIGGKLVTQEHADKIANYATKFGDLEKKADAARVEEKRPHDEAARDVQTKWKPVVDLAADKKKGAKKLFEGWALAERKRREEEAARIAEEQRKEHEALSRLTAAHGEPAPDAPPPPPPIENVKAGTRGRIALRTRTKWIVSDRAAFVAYLMAMETPPPDFVATLDMLAHRIGSAGGNPPGVMKTEETSAA